MQAFLSLLFLGLWLSPASLQDIPAVRISRVTRGRQTDKAVVTASLESPEVTSTQMKSNLVLNSKEIGTLELECKHHAPIVWKYKGHTSPLQVNITSLRRTIENKGIFQLNLFFYRISSQLTGQWSCQVVNGTFENVVSLFASEHGYRGRDPQFLEYGKEKVIYVEGWRKEILIPCPSYNNSFQAKLAKQVELPDGSRMYEDVEDGRYKYDPREGFLVKTEGQQGHFWGKYKCHEAKDITFDKVVVDVREKFDIQFSPAFSEVEILVKNSLKLSCGTNDTRLRVTMEATDIRMSPSYSNELRHAELNSSPLSYDDEGTVKCSVYLEEATATETLHHTVMEHIWTYSVINPSDKLRRGWRSYFSQREKQHNQVCWTRTSKVPSISYVQCSNPVECDVRSACFSLGSGCDALGAVACSGGCLRLAYNGAGRMICRGDGVFDAELSLFVGVSGAIHNSLKNLTNDSITVSIQRNDYNDIFVGAELGLNCTGTSFLFSRGFYWKITLSSNESYRLDNETRLQTSVAELASHVELFDARNGIITVLSTVRLLSASVLEIACQAPNWDSYQVTSFPFPVHLKVPTPPSFGKSETEVALSLGEVNFVLSCDTEGVPAPKVSWVKDDKELPKTLTVFDNGKILFDEVTSTHAGAYTCRSENPGGRRVKRFYISVSDSKQSVILGVSISGSILILILALIVALFWRRIQRQKAMLRNLTDAEIEEFLYGNPDAIDRLSDTNKQGHLLAYNKDYEFPSDNLEIRVEEKLGSGQYGLVLKGIAKNLFPGEEETEVAIKTLQPQADISYFKALLVELKIMSYIGRCPYLVNLLGACTTQIRNREIFIIVELCGNGSLEKFLRDHRNDFAIYNADGIHLRYSAEPQRVTAFYENQPGARPQQVSIQDLLRFSYNVACGMEYLESRRVIHGDLAARNVLLTSDLFAKIGDFGLSRQLYEKANYTKKQQAPLPWRWMAIESLCDMEFSHKSDVWAYGITLFEIFSLGEIPYPGMNWTEDFVKKLRLGYRPPKPDLADDRMYNLMVDCWRYTSADRPSFTELKITISNYMGQKGISFMTPPHIPERRKYNLEIRNQNYGINIEREMQVVELGRGEPDLKKSGNGKKPIALKSLG